MEIKTKLRPHSKDISVKNDGNGNESDPTNALVNMSANVSADCWPTVGQLSVDCRPTVGQLLADAFADVFCKE